MKKILLVLMLLASLPLLAGEPGFGTRKYTISGMAEYSYNTTWGHHGNFDVQALMPINRYFEMDAGLQFSTANVYSGTLRLRPKFELPVGELFIETDLHYGEYARNKVGDIVIGIGLGYRMDFVSFMLGSFNRVIDDKTRDWHSNESYIVEPFNLMYRLEVFCRPQDNFWNLSFMMSNVDDFHFERMWQPMFTVGAWYDVTENWRLNFAAQCKPTGMFHLDASFYGATMRAGFSYRF